MRGRLALIYDVLGFKEHPPELINPPRPFDHAPVGLSYPTVGLSNRPVELTNQPVTLSNRPV